MSWTQINFGDFSQPAEALEIGGHASRSSIQADVLKNSYTFSVRVLTKPLPYTPNGASVTGFKFQGRIIDGAIGTGQMPSPHRFYPNPCDLDTTTREGQIHAAKIIRLHTEFRAGSGAVVGQMPNVGDEVTVVLKPGNYSYNLKHAEFTSLDIKISNLGESNTTPVSCPSTATLAALFLDGGAGSTTTYQPQQKLYKGSDSTYTGQVLENGKIPGSLMGQLNGEYSTGRATLLKEHLVHWDGLAAAYKAHFGEKFPASAGGGYRTFESQLRLRNDPAKRRPSNQPVPPARHLAARPGTSKHGWGLALDISSTVVSFDNAKYEWLFNNAGRFNILHPCWARQLPETSAKAAQRCNGCNPTSPGKCGSGPVEVWHWEVSSTLQSAAFGSAPST